MMPGTDEGLTLLCERWKRGASRIVAASRKDAGLTQVDLAGEAGLTRNIVGNLESGRRVMTVIDLLSIARALEMDPKMLLERIVRW